MEKEVTVIEDIKIDMPSQVLQAYLGKGKGNLFIDNRHNNIGIDISKLSWQDLLEMALEKAPCPRFYDIVAELFHITERKTNTIKAGAEFLGVPKSTYEKRLTKVKDNKAPTLLKG